MSGVRFEGQSCSNGDVFVVVQLDGSQLAAGFTTVGRWARLVELATEGDMYVVRTANEEGE